jgi:hypothetical protein
MLDIVRRLDLGSSVAEFDEALARYFVEQSHSVPSS